MKLKTSENKGSIRYTSMYNNVMLQSEDGIFEYNESNGSALTGSIRFRSRYAVGFHVIDLSEESMWTTAQFTNVLLIRFGDLLL